MATPLHTAPSRTNTDALRAARILFRAVFVEAWRALGKYHLSDEDRRELAHRVVIAAFRRWHTYKEARGTPRQWLWGIARYEVHAFWRARRETLDTPAEAIEEVAVEPGNPEDNVAEHDLLERLLAELPPEQRQVIVLYDLYGYTYEEIAKLENTSVTRAHARRDAGMKALRAAAARWQREHEQRGVLPLPVSIEGLFAAYRAPEPPADAMEAVWRSVAAELGLPDTLDSEPPASGARRREPALAQRPSPADRRARLLGLLGLPASAVLGGLLTAVTLTRTEAPALAEQRAMAPTAPPPSIVASPITDASARDDTRKDAPPASGLATAPVRSSNDDNERRRAEQAILDRGYSALDRDNAAAALAACAEHARRFPKGELAAQRIDLQAEACARFSAAQGNTSPKIQQVCAGR